MRRRVEYMGCVVNGGSAYCLGLPGDIKLTDTLGGISAQVQDNRIDEVYNRKDEV